MEERDNYFLDLAYQEAQKGLKQNGIPIGAVLTLNDQVVSKGYNKRVQENSMIKHGEMDCLENTKRQISPKEMQRTTLYTTLSPCFMCAGCILLNKIPRVVIGEKKTFQQSESLLVDNNVTVIVLDDERCINMMLMFIKSNPKLWGEDIGLTPEQILKMYENLFSEYSL